MPNDNNYGGARAGAGKPKGRKNDATQRKEAAWKEALAGLADAAPGTRPLDIVLRLMRQALVMGDLDRTVAFASIALPYCHSRKAPVPEVDPNAFKASDIALDTDPQMADEGDPPPYLKAVA